MNGVRDALNRGLDGLGIEVSETARARLLAYLELLRRWNSAYNLTAVREPLEMVSKHVLDSVAVWPLMHTGRMIDVGTGAGLPGIPLFILGGFESALLVDSIGKKIRFCRHVIAELGLDQLAAVAERVERLPESLGGDWVVSRAFASLKDFVGSAGHLCRMGGAMMAMKGRPGADELQELPSDWRVKAQHTVRVPGLDAERCVLEVVRCNERQS